MIPGSNSTGLCLCGCGGHTSIIRKAHAGRRLVRGEYRAYLKGHHLRKSGVEYIEQDCGYETPCWVWQLGTTNLGYGRKAVNGRMMSAHRIYYENLIAPIPEGFDLDHLCRNPRCVNPAHLEPVTTSVNTRRGLTTKVTPEMVRIIRRRVRSGEKQYKVAQDFNLSGCTVSLIVRGLRWGDILDEEDSRG